MFIKLKLKKLSLKSMHLTKKNYSCLHYITNTIIYQHKIQQLRYSKQNRMFGMLVLF